MSVQPIIPSINTKNNNVQKIKAVNPNVNHNNNKVAFTGGNMIVSTMDFIEAGGYAASFIIQDGLGFIAPRVGKGLVRGGKKKRDEDGNVIMDENGKPKRELNWAYARKEGLRELITGPSAFAIPYVLLKSIKKHSGTGNNVKLDYLDSLQSNFTKFAQENAEAIKAGNADKTAFYKDVFSEVIENTVNTDSRIKESEKMTKAEIEQAAEKLTQRQLKIEEILSDKSLNKKAKAQSVKELGGTVEDEFMRLMKNRVGGTVNEMGVKITSSKGKLKGGNIADLANAMRDYFGDAANNVKKVLTKDATSSIEDAVKHFTSRRMGTRVFTNLGLFGAVAAFYTQIPKLYNMGSKGKNLAFADEDEADAPVQNKQANNAEKADEKKKDVAFTGGMAGFMEKVGDKVINGKHAKSISDIFELHGPIISGTAMPVLLYGFCIPPRLHNASDKYDYGEIVVRDMTAFTALLFGAKALARLFSDGFTKVTGLALNSKTENGRNVFQRTLDYLNPNDTHHSILSSKQLMSKYTNIEDYKGGINGFMDFIENSGGNIKKAFSIDKNIRATVSEIVKNVKGKSFAEATSGEIREALKVANENKDELIKKLYKSFDGNNGLLKRAKTCNSTFGFLSTIVFVPGLIMWLTDFCEKMTEKRKAQEKALAEGKANEVDASSNAKAEASQKIDVKTLSASSIPTNAPTMAGFLKK